jgi:hypothetical protein
MQIFLIDDELKKLYKRFPAKSNFFIFSKKKRE